MTASCGDKNFAIGPGMSCLFKLRFLFICCRSFLLSGVLSSNERERFLIVLIRFFGFLSSLKISSIEKFEILELERSLFLEVLAFLGRRWFAACFNSVIWILVASFCDFLSLRTKFLTNLKIDLIDGIFWSAPFLFEPDGRLRRWFMMAEWPRSSVSFGAMLEVDVQTENRTLKVGIKGTPRVNTRLNAATC